MALLSGCIVCLRDNPAFTEKAALWFAEKWDIPAEAYRESITQCIHKQNTVPQWYIMLDDSGQIIAGAGVIENDFHDRKDLSPNLCALFVENNWRKQGVAKNFLVFIQQDMAKKGFQTLYLLTEHTSFYEKCGWEFFTYTTGEDGATMRVYSVTTNPKLDKTSA